MVKCEKERIRLKVIGTNFFGFFAFLMTVFAADVAVADQMPNPRSASVTGVVSKRGDGRVVSRGDGDNSLIVLDSGRSAVRRSVTSDGRAAPNTKVKSARSASRQNMVGRSVSDANVGRSAVSNVRVGSVDNRARSATNSLKSGMARAATTARATAVFTDISKIGGPYAECREAYATCMDQFCANANDTYRRCYCSDRFKEFRDTEYALDEAKLLLQRFEDNNLNAVDKTAAEVNAMYSASVGEAAIKKDTSGAQKILDEIGDLLSGKRKVDTSGNATNSLGILSIDFTAEVDDIFGGGGSSIFDTASGVDLTTLEGLELYNASNKQCLQMISDRCENKATLNMSTSAYGIMIAQDCNAYEKSINAKREGVKNTVRQAEKILRDARLEEHRAHNSADVNECISKVKSAIVSDVACGANYKRCLDYSGKYVSVTTGEITTYDTSLFKLTEQIVLTGGSDVLGDNPNFNKFLDEKRMFAETALDTCRDLSDLVWQEFKRSALIEIAQAQSELIEETKMSCVSTIAECYDTQTSALKDFDNTTAQAAGALSAYAARAMCEDRVTRCAALYDSGQCVFNSKTGKLENNTRCGLKALLAFVDTVDTVRVAEGCAGAIENYVEDLCTPLTGDKEYPWNCRLKKMGSVDDEPDVSASASLAANIKYFALENCSDPTLDGEPTFDMLPLQTRVQVEKSINDVADMLDYQLTTECEDLDGYWVDKNDGTMNPLQAFYSGMFGGRIDENTTSIGMCVENSTRVQCLNYNTMYFDEDKTDDETVPQLAQYDLVKDECIFSQEWFRSRCALMGNGYFENGVCYVAAE